MNGHPREPDATQLHLLGASEDNDHDGAVRNAGSGNGSGNGSRSNYTFMFGGGDDDAAAATTGLKGLLASQGRIVFAFFLTLFVAMYYIASPVPPVVSDGLLGTTNTTSGSSGRKPADFHFLISTGNSDLNLCRLLLSAGVAGFPTPFLVNWEQKTFASAAAEDAARISEVNGFLRGLDESHDEDLVLMVDGADSWMQLRPQVLIDRFFAINAHANELILNQLGADIVEQKGIKQEIVFGSKTSCAPWTAGDPACYSVPESIAVLAPTKDGNSAPSKPKYLDDRTLIGTVKALKKLFAYAIIYDNSANPGPLLPHIFGEQALYRELIHRDAASYIKKLSGSGFRTDFNQSHLDQVSEKATLQPYGSLDFGIGLDYASAISTPPSTEEEGEGNAMRTAWLILNDTASVNAVQDARGIRSNRRQLRAIQSDVATSLPPFWTFTYESSLPRWRAWDEVSLLTDVFTGVTPAVIRPGKANQQQKRDGLDADLTLEKKDESSDPWSLLWSHPHIRFLYDAFIYSPILPIAVSGPPSTSTTGGHQFQKQSESNRKEYWPPEIWKGGARAAGVDAIGMPDGWQRFDFLCAPFANDLFRDDRGAWILPENH